MARCHTYTQVKMYSPAVNLSKYAAASLPENIFHLLLQNTSYKKYLDCSLVVIKYAWLKSILLD